MKSLEAAGRGQQWIPILSFVPSSFVSFIYDFSSGIPLLKCLLSACCMNGCHGCPLHSKREKSAEMGEGAPTLLVAKALHEILLMT